MDENRQAGIVLLVFISVILALYLRHRKKRRNRTIWSRNWLLRRDFGEGVLNCIDDEIRIEDPDTYRRYMRMNEEHFEYLLNLVEPVIRKEDTVMRQCIDARKRLSLTLRYLAIGETFDSLGISCRIHPTTVGNIVKETLQALKEKLEPIYSKVPKTEAEWNRIATDFYNIWNFPNCCGALDGKHVAFRPSGPNRALYYNYKGFHSIVLLALVDAHKRFLYVDVGVNGRISDGGVFAASTLNRALLTNSLNFPPPTPLPGRNVRVPYVILTDRAFPLRNNILKPYEYNGLTNNQLIFNSSLSGTRMVVENAFGILVNRFRVLLGPVETDDPHQVELIVHVCCALHNFMMERTAERYAYLGEEDLLDLPTLDGQDDAHMSFGRYVRLEFLRFFSIH